MIEEDIAIIIILNSHPPLWRKGNNKEYSQTPATTIVLLWRRLLTGVGPSIAAVNQGWNMNWADFPALHKIKEKEAIVTMNPKTGASLKKKSQLSEVEKKKPASLISKKTKIKKKKSVTRLNKIAFFALFVASSRDENQPIKIKDRTPTPSHPKKTDKKLIPLVNKIINTIKL